MRDIDGAHGEGGGQLLRMAVSLAALRETAVRITRIRAGRPNPGLAAQHVAAVRAVAALCSAEVEGLEIGSSEVVFRPGPIAPGRHGVDVGTAGSVALVLQACLPVALQADGPVQLDVTGGTDVRWAPPMDYVSRVFLPLLRRVGGDANVILHRRGYYPRGGGRIEVLSTPTREYRPIRLDGPAAVRGIRGIAHASNLPEGIPKRMKHAAMRRLHGRGDVKIEERAYVGEDAVGQGGALVLWAESEEAWLGSDALAERGKPSERVGEEAAVALLQELDAGAGLDVHAADQVLPYLAQADGPSSFIVREASGHLRTMAWLVPQFLDCEIDVQAHGGRWRVSVRPLG